MADGLRWQAGWCGRLGSRLYQDLLEHAAEDTERGGPVWLVLDAAGAPARAEALMRGEPALQMMGALHRLVLEGRAPELARFYPSTGGTPDAPAARQALIDTVEQYHDVLPGAHAAADPDERGRSLRRAPGGLPHGRPPDGSSPARARDRGQRGPQPALGPLSLHRAPPGEWGDPDSPVEIAEAFTGQRPPLDLRPSVVERRGCDPRPLDPALEDTRLTLLSYTWPDQLRRFTQLRAALDFAPSMPVEVERAAAVEWLEDTLAAPVPGVATVVFHSVVLPYLGEDGIAELWRTLDAAAGRAGSDTPLAWLSLEAGADLAEVRLMSWPGANAQLLAHASFHGPPVRWVG